MHIPFADRLNLIAKQVLQYRHMYRLDPLMEKLSLDLISAAAAG